MRKMVLLIIMMVILAAFAGCLGGEGKSKPKTVEMVRATGTANAEGAHELLAQASPESGSETVEITIPEGNITGVKIDVRVSDDDDGTPPDQVSGSVGGSGGGLDYNDTLPNSPTPYTGTVSFNAGEGLYLPMNWKITIDVVCHASDSQTPGFFIWIGTPDNGFSYNVTITYTYLVPME
jgi:hypothetical protein